MEKYIKPQSVIEEFRTADVVLTTISFPDIDELPFEPANNSTDYF